MRDIGIQLVKPQVMTLGAGSVQSAVLSTHSVVIRPSVDVFVALGANPVAAVNGATCHFIGGGEAILLNVVSPSKIAAIPASGTTGVVYLSEVL